MIRTLSEDTIQKIAAGEVIERPVSVVKELVENAIDAGAKQIEVVITSGGKDHIRVSDDGSGIEADQFETAFLRHATSKIADFDDLYRIHSLGFRGEALASIIAVAKVRATTKTESDAYGTELRYANSELLSKQPIGTTRGTSIEVDEIFYNLPVRRQFLKSSTAESNHITALLYSLAIGNPTISLRYVKDDRLVFQTERQNSLLENLLVLFGKAYHDAALPFDMENETYHIQGYIGDNTFYRGNRQMQFLYVNSRLVEDEEITAALEEEYRSIIPNGRFPGFQLFIETDPKNIDINIHPNKKKVNFAEKTALLADIKKAVARTLSEGRQVPDATIGSEGNKKASGNTATQKKSLLSQLQDSEQYQRVLDAYHQAEHTSSKETWNRENPEKAENKTDGERDPSFDMGDYLETLDLSGSVNEGNTGDAEAKQNDSTATATEHVRDAVERDATQGVQGTFGNDDMAPAEETATGETSEKPANKVFGREMRYVGILFRTYIVFEKDSDTLLLIDQHAAHERVNYERFLKAYADGEIVSQQLAMPETIHVDELRMQSFEEKEAAIQDMGFDVSTFGNDTLVLRAVPSLFHAPENRSLLFDLLDLDWEKGTSLDRQIHTLATKACKASVKQGDVLSYEEVMSLYAALQRCDNPLSCPHGRPTMLELSKRDLEKMFVRIK